MLWQSIAAHSPQRVQRELEAESGRQPLLQTTNTVMPAHLNETVQHTGVGFLVRARLRLFTLQLQPRLYHLRHPSASKQSAYQTWKSDNGNGIDLTLPPMDW